MTHDISFDASCPECGEVELAADQLWLVITTGPTPDHFAFRCPACTLHVRCPIDAETASVLAELVPVEEIDVPAEALERHVGAPLTLDDLIELGVRLARSDFPAAAALRPAA